MNLKVRCLIVRDKQSLNFGIMSITYKDFQGQGLLAPVLILQANICFKVCLKNYSNNLLQVMMQMLLKVFFKHASGLK